jgi:hypothetical protein
MHKPPLDGGGLAGDAVLLDWCLGYQTPTTKHPTDKSSAKPLTAVLIVRSVGRYSVSFHDEIVVENSRDPELDAARALVRRGLTGSVKIIDASGKHRSTIPDIVRASRLRTREGPLRFSAYETLPEPSSADEGDGGEE